MASRSLPFAKSPVNRGDDGPGRKPEASRPDYSATTRGTVICTSVPQFGLLSIAIIEAKSGDAQWLHLLEPRGAGRPLLDEEDDRPVGVVVVVESAQDGDHRADLRRRARGNGDAQVGGVTIVEVVAVERELRLN